MTKSLWADNVHMTLQHKTSRVHHYGNDLVQLRPNARYFSVRASGIPCGVMPPLSIWRYQPATLTTLTRWGVPNITKSKFLQSFPPLRPYAPKERLGFHPPPWPRAPPSQGGLTASFVPDCTSQARRAAVATTPRNGAALAV